MEHTYKITGMSCNGCHTKVENALNAIEGMSAVVTLEPPQAKITMQKHIPTEKLQEALSAVGNYTIEMSGHHHSGTQSNHLYISSNNTLHNTVHGRHHKATEPMLLNVTQQLSNLGKKSLAHRCATRSCVFPNQLNGPFDIRGEPIPKSGEIGTIEWPKI